MDSNPLSYVDYYDLSGTIVLPRPLVVPRPRPFPAEPFDPASPIPDAGFDQFDSLWPNPNQNRECWSLLRKMDNIKRDIAKREREILENTDLSEYIGPGERLRDTVRGHRKIVRKLENRLRELEKKYDEKCTPSC